MEEEKSREQRLEAAFLQFVEEVYKMRLAQIYFKEHYGANNRQHMARRQEKVDDILVTMGVHEQTDFKDLQLSFIKEILNKPATGKCGI